MVGLDLTRRNSKDEMSLGPPKSFSLEPNKAAWAASHDNSIKQACDGHLDINSNMCSISESRFGIQSEGDGGSLPRSDSA